MGRPGSCHRTSFKVNDDAYSSLLSVSQAVSQPPPPLCLFHSALNGDQCNFDSKRIQDQQLRNSVNPRSFLPCLEIIVQLGI